MRIHYGVEHVNTHTGLSIHNLMPAIKQHLAQSGIQNGVVTVCSRHTTTAITINEDESRLRDDIAAFFAKLVPASDRYLHNDIHLRDCPPDEPENAHSHLIAMLLGSSESIPLCNGELSLGQWQSVMLLELDGPRPRTVSIQIIGQ
ncbi:MAG: secondary thiamine-phosphate synthase enzyme YjbQ [Gammaproteobacteria bacterium]|nr:secondary thiamine-phosphate synthase enzyme YjbQ [Gammaproteobacteria bacterium]